MKLVRLLASPLLMYLLAGAYALIMAIATLVENSAGTAFVCEHFYYAPWFILLQLLQAGNLLAIFLYRDYFKKINLGSLMFHGALLLMWLGAATTHYAGTTGLMHIREGQTVDYMISDENQTRTPLPFTTTLTDFRLMRYPGSMSPRAYESDLTIKKEGAEVQQACIRMNKVIEVEGYRLFQSSFDPDEGGTVLSVSYDRPGMQITYAGYFLLFLGFILVLFSKRSRFGRLRRELAKMKDAASLTTPIIITAFLLLSASSIAQAQPCVPAGHAALFGRLQVLNPNGRVEPVNSYTSALLRKLHGADRLGKINSDQFFLNLWAFPDEWGKQPFIKVTNSDILSRFGRTGKYMAWQDVFDASGNYLLADEVSALYAKPASARNRLDTDLLKLDECVNIVYQIMQHQMMPLFPNELETHGKWYSPGDDLETFQGKDSMFVSKIMDWYGEEIFGGIRTGKWAEADKVVGMIGVYQQAKGKAVVISPKKLEAELFYNRANIFTWCRLAYLILGGLLLMIACREMFGKLKWGRTVGAVLVGLLLVSFLAHTGGVALRWYIAGHAPWTNAYESMVCTSWLLVGGGLLFARRFRILPALAALLGGIMLFVAGLNHLNPEITPLVPVLQSYWLMSHVAIIMVGYVFFALCALMGLFNLVLMNLLTTANRAKLLFRINELTLLNEMAMILGLFFMTAGTFLGAVWANVSWGRYWGWDPKETWALISIVVYVLVLHLRFIPLLKGKSVWNFNLLSVIAVAAVIMTWFGVNYYLSGLHSYGKTDGDIMLWAWGSGLGAVVVLALMARRRFVDQ